MEAADDPGEGAWVSGQDASGSVSCLPLRLSIDSGPVSRCSMQGFLGRALEINVLGQEGALTGPGEGGSHVDPLLFGHYTQAAPGMAREGRTAICRQHAQKLG